MIRYCWKSETILNFSRSRLSGSTPFRRNALIATRNGESIKGPFAQVAEGMRLEHGVELTILDVVMKT